VRTWGVERLPRSLTRRSRSESGDGSESSLTVDVDALKSIMGGKGDGGSNKQGIMAFGKTLDTLRSRERRDD
jgi:hypothetical protein